MLQCATLFDVTFLSLFYRSKHDHRDIHHLPKSFCLLDSERRKSTVWCMKTGSICSIKHTEIHIHKALCRSCPPRIQNTAIAVLGRSQAETGFTLPVEPVRFDRLPVKPVRFGSGLGRFQTVPNLKFKFEFKKMKNSQKNPENTSRCDESNGVKFSQKFVRLAYFLGI